MIEMKEILTEIISAVQEKKMTKDVAVKAIMNLRPSVSEMYNEANDHHYAHFQKYLKNHAYLEHQKLINSDKL